MDLKELFGDGRLSFEELMVKLTDAGAEFGDLAAVRAEYDGKITDLKKNFALERELERAGVKNRALMERVLDHGKISVDEDGVHGISEQIEALRESDPYLFETAAQPQQNMASPVKWGAHHGNDVPDTDSMSDAEYYKVVKRM
ncbi:MAG: phage scaffolding protein [Clostridia bacterium]|nr:phage scaffolding protein [Clostridia bacterium]MBQ8511578.1 phage scaffolding protein [Clostridia bacterium]